MQFLETALDKIRHWIDLRRVPEVLQFEVTECGACCLAMVLASFGRWEPLDYLRGLCGASRDGVGKHYGRHGCGGGSLGGATAVAFG